MKSAVAFMLHSVIEGIGNAPQYKTPEKQLSEREYWRRQFINRETPKNDETKVKRGRATKT